MDLTPIEGEFVRTAIRLLSPDYRFERYTHLTTSVLERPPATYTLVHIDDRKTRLVFGPSEDDVAQLAQEAGEWYSVASGFHTFMELVRQIEMKDFDPNSSFDLVVLHNRASPVDIGEPIDPFNRHRPMVAARLWYITRKNPGGDEYDVVYHDIRLLGSWEKIMAYASAVRDYDLPVGNFKLEACPVSNELVFLTLFWWQLLKTEERTLPLTIEP